VRESSPGLVIDGGYNSNRETSGGLSGREIFGDLIGGHLSIGDVEVKSGAFELLRRYLFEI
jgi:hypothetical protein